ncbi:S8 family peptidase [Glycomyces terrestris]|nr:S8 family serine peptidase [Glycomyces terrestris]
MAIPLTPTPAEPRTPHRALRTALGAGLTALAAAAALAATPGAALAQDTTLNDENAWATDLIQAPAAWGTTQGEGVTVAVLDTGIAEHPFFEGKDILPGYTAYSDEQDAWNDADGHGSAVAAAVLLAAPRATIMPVRMDTGADTDGLGGAMGETDVEAVKWAVDNGADVLVIPWHIDGNVTGDPIEIMQYAIDKGVVVVASAGNDPSEPVLYPASTPGVIAVTGADTNGEFLSESSSTGPEVVLSAPADEMTVPKPILGALAEDTDIYATVIGGTSMGSGFVGGVAALTWAAHPDLDASNVIQRLIQTAGDASGTRGDEVGYGLVNADQAVHAEGIEPVEENPLGYPMGEAGASGATPDDTQSAEEGGEEPGAASGGPSAAAEGNKESNLSAIIVVAAAVVLVGAAIAVWIVLRGRGRKAAAAQQGEFTPPGGPGQGALQQPAPAQQTYVPQGGQNYGGPPPGQQGFSSPPQGFNPPGNPGEQSPWRPSEPNQR